MVAITATTSATPSLQAALNQSRLEQARRDADRAETTAKSLREQADAAEQEAQKDRERVRDLSSASQQTEATYSASLRETRSEVPPSTQEFLTRLLKTESAMTPVLNTQGQKTGRIINLNV